MWSSSTSAVALRRWGATRSRPRRLEGRTVAGRRMQQLLVAIAVAVGLGTCVAAQAYSSARDRSLDGRLAHRLQELGFTGRIESTLTTRLGRPLDPRLANIGRLLWFDTVTGLN